MSKEWNVKLGDLPGKESENIYWISDEYYESPNERYLAIVYSIKECGMGWYMGRLVIFSNKNNPKILIDTKKILCHGMKNHIFYSKDSRYIFIKMKVNIEHKFKVILPFLIMDLKKNRFSYYLIVNNYGYSVEQIGDDAFKLVESYKDQRFKSHDGVIIKTNELKWIDINQINTIDEIINNDITINDYEFGLC